MSPYIYAGRSLSYQQVHGLNRTPLSQSDWRQDLVEASLRESVQVRVRGGQKNNILAPTVCSCIRVQMKR